MHQAKTWLRSSHLWVMSSRRVVFVGHLDSHRAVFWFANNFLVTLFALSSP